MSFLNSIFSKGATDILHSANEIIDNISTSDQEKLDAKSNLSSIVFDTLNDLKTIQKDIIISEATGNFLQRSWRPIAMLTFVAIVVLGAFVEIPYLENNSKFWDLLELGLGGYVIGRTSEKLVSSIVQNIDIPFLKKKDRADKIK